MEVCMALLKCLKSDLAVVVHDHYEKNNLGLIVRVERYAGTNPIETFKPSNPFKPVGRRNMRCWWVRAVSKPGICMMDAEDKLYYKAWAVFPDCWLKPIRGEPSAEREQSQKEQEVERLDEELLSKALLCQ
jgi:hypothetical protein